MPYLSPVGDSALRVTFGDHINAEINQRVHAFARALQTNPHIIEIVPAYANALIHYDPLTHSLDDIIALAQHALTQSETYTEEARLVEIPVIYDGDDLAFVAQYHSLTVEQVIQRHTTAEYRVYMMGFTPGFPYLGGLDPHIATPRLETPRPKVPAGSVGIAGEQTGIYPIASPGGWRLIGRTEVKLFDPTHTPPTLLQPGDRVRFIRR